MHKKKSLKIPWYSTALREIFIQQSNNSETFFFLRVLHCKPYSIFFRFYINFNTKKMWKLILNNRPAFQFVDIKNCYSMLGRETLGMIIEDWTSLESIKHAIYASFFSAFNFSGIVDLCEEKSLHKILFTWIQLSKWWSLTKNLMTVPKNHDFSIEK